MTTPAHRRHNISDHVWELLEHHLPGRRGAWGGIARDNRQFINAVFWILRTGAPWRDLPPDYGDWKNDHRRFCRWRDKGVWEKLLEILIDEPDYEWLMIDVSHVKIHAHAAGAKGGNQDMGRTKKRGGQHQDTSGRGCAWYAGPNGCHSRYHGGLYPGFDLDRGYRCPVSVGRQRVRQQCDHRPGAGTGDGAGDPAPQEPQTVPRL